MTEKKDQPLLTIRGLKTYFSTDEGLVRAVDGLDLEIGHGQIVGMVGESGCGKSVTSQSILQVVPHPGRIEGGEILLSTNGKTVDIAKLDPKGKEIRNIRGLEIAMIFQEPMTAFSPVHTIGNQIMEAIRVHGRIGKAEARAQALAMLTRVAIPKPDLRIDAYPHQLSGGMRQRAMIAMALCCRPKLLIADEPTTALDVTIQAQILDLIKDLQGEMQMAVLLITHNLGVVAELADEVVVMYLGKEVERAAVNDLFDNPLHPYTRQLLKSVPRPGVRNQGKLENIKGILPNPFHRPDGCPFHPRCPDFISGVCDKQTPPLEDMNERHSVACHLHDKPR
jgi:peptide/nickel transport system ATP-binding protein